MHILILASGYPNDFSPYQGIFFRDQAESLAGNKQNRIGVIAVVPIPITSVLKAKRLAFGLVKSHENGVQAIVRTFLNIPKLHRYRIQKSRKLAVKLLSDYLAEFGKPDIIHVHGYQAGLQALDAKEKFGIPYVVTEHSSQFIDQIVPAGLESFAETVFKQADTAIAVSEPFAKILSAHYSREFVTIPNVVDTAVFHIDPYAAKRKEFTFFLAASFVVEKNHPLLIEAFSRVQATYPQCRLRLAGGGAGMDAIKALVTALKMDKQVDFLGMLPRTEIVREMQQMDAFVLSSKVETFGVVLIEALSCGKPVISTRCFGPESIVTSPEIGILCDPDPEALAAAMIRMITDYAAYDPEVIRKYAIDRFSNDVVMNQLMECYHKVVSKLNT